MKFSKRVALLGSTVFADADADANAEDDDMMCCGTGWLYYVFDTLMKMNCMANNLTMVVQIQKV
jgi:hypothetical protein